MRVFRSTPATIAAAVALVPQLPAETFSVDIDSTRLSATDTSGPLVTEVGFSSLDATDGDAGRLDRGGIVFGIFSADGSRLRPGGGGANPNALTGDFVFDDGPGDAVGITFGGLPGGVWQVELWCWDQTSPLGPVTVGWRRNNLETLVGTDFEPDPELPVATFTLESDGAAAYDAFIRENNDEDRARLNGARLTLLEGPEFTTIDGFKIEPEAAEGTLVGTFATTSPDMNGPFVYELAAGDGATNNGEFQIVGNELRTSALFGGYVGAERLSVRVRTTDAAGFFRESAFPLLVIFDSDMDELDDNWELRYFNDLMEATGLGNNDSDSLLNLTEQLNDTAPNDGDTDDDTLPDDDELLDLGTDPTNPDTDADTLRDDAELLVLGTDPRNPDTDDDSFRDDDELLDDGTDPTDPEDSILTGAVLLADVGNRDGNGVASPLQAGWDQLDALSGNGGWNVTSAAGASATLSATGGSNFLDTRVRTAAATDGGSRQAVWRDFVFGNGSNGAGEALVIALENLDPNTAYAFTVWGYDSGSGSPRTADWYAADSGGPAVLKVAGATFDGTDPRPGFLGDYQQRFEVLTDASGAVTVSAVVPDAGADGTHNLFINGFAVGGKSIGSSEPPFLVTSITLDLDLELVTLRWRSVPGATYTIRASPTLAGDPLLWPVLGDADADPIEDETEVSLPVDVANEPVLFYVIERDP